MPCMNQPFTSSQARLLESLSFHYAFCGHMDTQSVMRNVGQMRRETGSYSNFPKVHWPSAQLFHWAWLPQCLLSASRWLRLWNAIGPQIQDPEMTFSVTQNWLFGVQKKWLKNDSPKMTFFRGQSQHFWGHFPLNAERSFLSHFNCFAIPGPVAPSADHKTTWMNSMKLGQHHAIVRTSILSVPKALQTLAVGCERTFGNLQMQAMTSSTQLSSNCKKHKVSESSNRTRHTLPTTRASTMKPEITAALSVQNLSPV